jgi:protein-S-isoprenylcysteine O-methyltransferase Ste14
MEATWVSILYENPGLYLYTMKQFGRHLLSFILPVTVLIIVPSLIEKRILISLNVITIIGFTVMLFGITLMVLTIRMFIRIGKGTLAPWDPTRKLVTKSLYAHVRNPMILGVNIVLIGEAITFRSNNILIWAGCFFILNTVYFIFSEEPGLKKRFGDEYEEYKRNVPRWIPRIRPWRPTQL